MNSFLNALRFMKMRKLARRMPTPLFTRSSATKAKDEPSITPDSETKF
jgi:hypothetical protein